MRGLYIRKHFAVIVRYHEDGLAIPADVLADAQDRAAAPPVTAGPSCTAAQTCWSMRLHARALQKIVLATKAASISAQGGEAWSYGLPEFLCNDHV